MEKRFDVAYDPYSAHHIACILTDIHRHINTDILAPVRIMYIGVYPDILQKITDNSNNTISEIRSRSGAFNLPLRALLL